MILKILIADPDKQWSRTIKKYLTDQNYEVSLVYTGKDVQKILYDQDFFAIMINYNIENHSCMQTLKYIKLKKKGIHVVLLLNSEKPFKNNSLNKNQLIKYGVSEAMIKPFEFEDVKNLLDSYKSLQEFISTIPKSKNDSTDEEEYQIFDDDVFGVAINEFLFSKTIFFDVYIKLSEHNYVKILNAGDPFSEERVKKYRDQKNVKQLYLLRSDQTKYTRYSNHLASQLMKKPGVNTSKKVNLLKHISSSYIENVFTSGINHQIIKQGKEICENIYELIEKEDELYKVLKELTDLDPNAFTHAYLVSLFSSAVVKQFKWQSKTTIETIALAGMMHDVGKIKLPLEFMTLRPEEMDDEQRKIYEQHPEKGVELLENTSVGSSIKGIVLQHHESYDGSGFPNQLKGAHILTLANVLHLVDNFVHVVQEKKLKPLEALRDLLISPSHISRYNHLIIESFIKIFTNPKKIMNDPFLSKLNINKKAS